MYSWAFDNSNLLSLRRLYRTPLFARWARAPTLDKGHSVTEKTLSTTAARAGMTFYFTTVAAQLECLILNPPTVTQAASHLLGPGLGLLRLI
jgi:hypothetical protein